jgi:hypothetical protein
MRSHTARRAVGSNPTVGSSRNKTRGRCNMLCAISSRRIIPPEYVRTSLSPTSVRSINPRASLMRVVRSERGRSYSLEKTNRFSYPVRVPSADKSCGTYPIILRTSRGELRICAPAISASPDVGERSVVSILITVVLPAPFGPNNPKTSPAFTEIVNPSTAVISPYFRVKASVVKMLIRQHLLTLVENFRFVPDGTTHEAPEYD